MRHSLTSQLWVIWAARLYRPRKLWVVGTAQRNSSLKKYLRDRGIPFSNYTKRELQEMVKCVLSPHIVDVIEVIDDAGVKAQRRKIEVNGNLDFFS